MNPQLLESLRPIIRKGLDTMMVERGHYPLRLYLIAFLAGENKFKHGNDRRKLQRFVDDDYALLELVNHFLLRKLRGNPFKMETKQEPLREQPGCGDLDALTDEFMTLMQRLPLHYAFSFPLPTGTLASVDDGGCIEVAPDLRFVKATTDALAAEFPLTLGSRDLDNAWLGPGSLLFDAKAEFKPDTLQIFEEGYVGVWGSTLPSKRAQQRYVSVLGFCVAAGLFKAVPTFESVSTIRKYLVHEYDGAWLPIDRADLNVPASGYASALVVDPSPEAEPQLYKDRLYGVLNDLRVVFRDEESNQRLVRAAEWYFNALAGSDPLLQFVQMMVVLEIIYGDEAPNEKIGLGELLRNRCAYAIGTTAAEREEIAKTFPEIYKVRSKIVHTGKNRLSMSETVLYSQLSAYCRRAIAHEIRLLARDDAAREERARRALVSPKPAVSAPSAAPKRRAD